MSKASSRGRAQPVNLAMRLGALIPRIRPTTSVGRSRRAPPRMSRARIPHQHGLFLHGVAALTVGGAWVYGVFEVDAFADGVALDDFVAHSETNTLECDGGLRKIVTGAVTETVTVFERRGEMWG